eukprot:jgi/Undpi1/13014/HiC_scaffold_7.g02678.m1
MVTILAWATVAFVSVALERVSAAPSRPGMEAITSPPVDPGRVAGPICWETQGLYERDCFHDEPLTADTYPLTYEMLERASSRYTTTGLSLNRAFQKGRKRGELKIMVLGGSVTAGHDCRSPAGLSGKDCAWPHRLQQWCDERIDDVTVEVDLIIVDFGVNDAVLEQFDMEINNVKLAHEVFIRYVRNDMINMPALLYGLRLRFIPGARTRQAPLQASNMAEVHAAVTMKYDIPMVSFRDAVWPDMSNSSLADSIWGSAVHPDWQVHQLLADVLVYFIQKSYARFLVEHGPRSNPSSHERAVSVFEERQADCMLESPLFILDASKFVGLPPPAQMVESVGWSFSEDERGPGGLIGFGNSSTSAVVMFDIPCASERGLLDVGYLRSYIGMGAVKMVVSGSDTGPGDIAGDHSNEDVVIILDGLWNTEASIVITEVIPTPSGIDNVRVTFEILSADKEPLHAKPPHGVMAGREGDIRLDRKFKVSTIQCC